MIKTIASVKREIEILQAEKAECYEQHISPIDDQIIDCNRWIKQNCRHTEDNLIISTVTHDDEYGKYIESWTEYHVECGGCGRTVFVNKAKFSDSNKTFQDIVGMFADELKGLQ